MEAERRRRRQSLKQPLQSSQTILKKTAAEDDTMSSLHEIGVFLVFCAGLVFCGKGLYEIWKTVDIRRAGGRAAGTVIDRRRGREVNFMTVSFLTARQREVQFEQYSSSFFRKKEYTVFYTPAAPHRATVSPWADLLGGILMTGCGVLFVSLTYATLFTM